MQPNQKKNCLWKDSCTNPICPYIHPKNFKKIVCHYKPCTNPNCKYDHPAGTQQTLAYDRPPGTQQNPANDIPNIYKNFQNIPPPTTKPNTIADQKDLRETKEFDKEDNLYEEIDSVETLSTTSENSRPICIYGDECRKFECKSIHNKKLTTNKCPEEIFCQNFECKLLHPYSRKKPCSNIDCTNYFCKNLHPNTRNGLCLQEVCSDYFCNLLHPTTDRPNPCQFASNCFKENCKFLHPIGGALCEDGNKCIDCDCKLVHPPGRNKLCNEFCSNINCESIHSKIWDPKASGGKNLAEKALRTQKERDQFRLKNLLPIRKAKDEIIYRLKREKILVVTAATGSGKTTQLPQYTAEAFPGLIVCTQPRVLAAITLAQRIASEYDNSSVGNSVGYQISGGNNVKGKKIMLMTDGALVHKAQEDPLLKDISVLIIDEAHERSLNTDLVIGIAKLLIDKRPNDFHVIISSATINPKPFLDFFSPKINPTPSLDVFYPTDSLKKSLDIEGRVFEIKDEEDPTDFSGGYEELIPKVVDILEKNPEGNCLVFLPGAGEIDNAVRKFNLCAKNNWVSFPLYGSLPPEEQALVMAFDDQNNTLRMIVFCTNVAETSLTVPNIRIVIDTGLVKEARYDPIRRITVIEQVFVSNSSMKQRRGRAGRTAEGLFVKLYKAAEAIKRENIEPEIIRSSLDLVVLQLKILNYDPITFPFMDKPKIEVIESSIKLLVELQCLEKSPKNRITNRGKLFAELPFDPRMSNFLITGHEIYDQAENCAIIASILTAPGSIFFYGGGKEKIETKEKIIQLSSAYHSDIEFLMDIYIKWFNFGKTTDNICETCKMKVPSVLLTKNKGCKSCRTEFSNKNRLNNKIMEIILKTKENVLEIILSEKFLQENKEKKLLPLSEMIGRCLISSFKDQIGQLLLPEYPDTGLILLDSGLKGSFSTTSVFSQKQQKSFSQVISMKITQIPNGSIIVDQVHPLLAQWIPLKYMQKLKETFKKIEECLVYTGLSGRYRSILLKEIRERNYNWLFFAVTYDNLNATLTIYAPLSENQLVVSFCKDIIEKQKIQDLKFENIIEVSNRSLKGFFTPGMQINKVEPTALSQILIELPYDVISIEDLYKFLRKEGGGIEKNEIKWCRIRKDKKKADITFFNKETAEKAKTTTKTVELNRKPSNYKYFFKIYPNGSVSKARLEQEFRELDISPIEIREKYSDRKFAICINNFPPEYSTQSKIEKAFEDIKVEQIIVKTDKNGYYYAVLVFGDVDECQSSLKFLQESPFAYKTFTSSRGKKISPLFTIKGDTRYPEENEFTIILSEVEEADLFYSIYKYPCEGFLNVRFDKNHLNEIKNYLGKLESCIKIKSKINGVIGNYFNIELYSDSSKLLNLAMQQIMNALTPMYMNIETRKQQIIFNRLNESGFLDQWARRYEVQYLLSEDKKTGEYNKLELIGSKISQSEFMGEIMNYFKNFINCFVSVLLPIKANFLFRQGEVGSLFLNLLNKDLGEKGLVTFLNQENAIEIYVNRDEIVKIQELSNKIKKFIAEHSDVDSFQDKMLNSCVFCKKNGAQDFFICGHNYCTNCLYSETNRVVPMGVIVECPKCHTPVSFKDIRNSFPSWDELLILAQRAVYYYLTNNPKSDYALCPLERCQLPREKKLGYSACPNCNTLSCPVCQKKYSKKHKGVTCKIYQENKKRTGEFEISTIIAKAKKFVEENWDYISFGNPEQVQVNSGLELGSPGIQKFYSSMKNLGINPLKNGFFAWYGTGSEDRVIKICHEGFDPKLRNGHMFGLGEFFNQTVVTCPSNRIILAYLLNIPQTLKNGNYCYTVNNPMDWSLTYSLAVLVVTYKSNGKSPVRFIEEPKKILGFLKNEVVDLKINKNTNINEKTKESFTKVNFQWGWYDEVPFIPYENSINFVFEWNYQAFIKSKKFKNSLFMINHRIFTIILLANEIAQSYIIDFEKMTQTNSKSDCKKKIHRIQF